MKSMLLIIKKEFKRFFSDPRMIIAVLIPGLMIYVMYSVMGGVVNKVTTDKIPSEFTAYVIYMPEIEEIKSPLASVLSIKEGEGLSQEQMREKVKAGEVDLLLIFPENFEANITASAKNVPNIEIYYNSAETASSVGFSTVSTILNNYENSLSNVFDINAGENGFDLADEKSFATQILSMIFPMLIIMLLASGCISIAPESIAGEKERGTMATMLITPINRAYIALGKVISLSGIAMLSALSSFLGIVFSLPKLAGAAMSGVSLSIYPVSYYFLILLIIISVVLVIISMFSLISALAKTSKEAAAYMTPAMILIMLLGLFSMFSQEASVYFALIPVFGSALALTAITSFTVTPLVIVLSILSNLALTAVFVTLLTLAFKSEKIMFNK